MIWQVSIIIAVEVVPLLAEEGNEGDGDMAEPAAAELPVEDASTSRPQKKRKGKWDLIPVRYMYALFGHINLSPHSENRLQSSNSWWRSSDGCSSYI